MVPLGPHVGVRGETIARDPTVAPAASVNGAHHSTVITGGESGPAALVGRNIT
jgi:hypothetical protein